MIAKFIGHPSDQNPLLIQSRFYDIPVAESFTTFQVSLPHITGSLDLLSRCVSPQTTSSDWLVICDAALRTDTRQSVYFREFAMKDEF